MAELYMLIGGVVLGLGWPSLAALYLTYFCMSIMFPTIFALGLKDLGGYDKERLLGTCDDHCRRSRMPCDYGADSRCLAYGCRFYSADGLLRLYSMVCLFQGEEHIRRLIFEVFSLI